MITSSMAHQPHPKTRQSGVESGALVAEKDEAMMTEKSKNSHKRSVVGKVGFLTSS